MTVLPNAPIDADTGLPVPTIAVATNGGVSVIKDDGSVVDIAYASYTAAKEVEFVGEGIFTAFDNVIGNNRFGKRFNAIPSSDLISAGTPYNSDNGEDADYYTYTTWVYNLSIAPTASTLTCFSNLNFGYPGGFSRLSENQTDPDKGMVVFVASDYNTGYQVGDIKLATLSDTDTTNAVGTELVSQTASGWTLPTGFSHNGSGTLTAASNTGQYQKAYDVVNTVVGKDYTITFNVTAKSGSMSFWIANSASYTSAFATQNPISGTGIKSFSFTATSTSMYVVFQCNALGNTLTVTDISLRLAESDRSVNNNALQVFGTVTKTAVATGADLVAYSGFSSSNYLQQPYNADLNFGTGDFSINLWVKGGSTGTVVFDRLGADQHGLQGSSTDSTKRLYIYTNANRWEFIAGQTGITAAEALIDISSEWKLLTCIRKSGVMSMYENGVHKHSKANTNSVGDTDHITRIGTGILWHVSPHSGSVALVRVSATAPSVEQIAKIYNDEKHLFSTNAKATLYGTSDAVTALAYDDDTELLHVGTSAGRSEFQGLRRVNNTTDVVSTAISASNGFIVEE
jgi:hypothetical protein